MCLSDRLRKMNEYSIPREVLCVRVGTPPKDNAAYTFRCLRQEKTHKLTFQIHRRRQGVGCA